MNKWRQALLIALIMGTVLTNATAGRQNTPSERGSASDPAAGISEQRAITIAQQHFKGRVLAINQTDHLYRVKILSDQGTVHTILINALDGSVVSTH
ncbi:MAG: PepSY domain-containing protein [Gammaproteobacteria bacterium]|nr:MAG: PepSY domain-containing protein [Gammaproteobacteria bacterium]